MGRYVVKRLLQVVPVFFGATFLIFALVYAVPGDPIDALAGDKSLTPAVRAELRDRYNLDDPLFVRYGKYVGGLVQGDFGENFRGREVSEVMRLTVVDVEDRVEKALERCFMMKARAAQRAATRTAKVTPAKAAAATATVSRAATARRQAR